MRARFWGGRGGISGARARMVLLQGNARTWAVHATGKMTSRKVTQDFRRRRQQQAGPAAPPAPYPSSPAQGPSAGRCLFPKPRCRAQGWGSQANDPPGARAYQRGKVLLAGQPAPAWAQASRLLHSSYPPSSVNREVLPSPPPTQVGFILLALCTRPERPLRLAS